MSSRCAPVARIRGQTCSGYQFRSIEPRHSKTLGFVATLDGFSNLYRDFLPVLPTVLHGFKKKERQHPLRAVTVEDIVFMGYAVLATKSSSAITQQIKRISVDTGSIVILDHAGIRMLQRGVGINEVYEVLRHGSMVRPWRINKKYDTFECRMERYVGGRELAVGVTLCDEDPGIVVVTVIVGQYKEE